MHLLKLQIAAEPFTLELPRGPLAEALEQAWRAFLDPAAPRGRTIRFIADGRPSPSGPRHLPALEGTRLRGAGFEAELSGLHAEVVGANERFGIESVLKLLLASALLPRSALLVHSVALGEGGSGAVLLAESGAGKSTLGELGAAAGLRRLADELVVLEAGRAHGTPWNVGSPDVATVRLLGTLGWSDRCRLEPIPAAEFLPLLLANTLLPDEAPAARAAVFRIASGILAALPPERFFFPPDASAADFLRAELLSRATRPPPPRAG